MLRIAAEGGRRAAAAAAARRAMSTSVRRVVNAGAVVTPAGDGRSVQVLTGEDARVEIGADGRVTALGREVPAGEQGFAEGEGLVLDAGGGVVTPGFVDPHTHLFPSRDRADEFSLRPVKSYEEIAAAGGGILSTVQAVRAASEDELVEANVPLLQQFVAQGTTTVEIKSGYGLTVEDELKSLSAIARLQQRLKDQLTIVPTFLGAHAFPKEFKGGREQEYIDIICNEMIPEVARRGLARYCDVFCEIGYFDAAQSEQVLQCALDHGLEVRLHADEFVDSGGAELAAKLGAHSADHLMAVSEAGIAAMAASAAGDRSGAVVATALPGTTLFLGKGHSFAPMREMIDAGCAVAVASDFNPGSSVYQSMPLMMQLCMTRGSMSFEESFLAATYNAALALRLQDQVGTLQPGANADLVVWSLDTAKQIPYYGVESRHRISAVVKNGRFHSHSDLIGSLGQTHARVHTRGVQSAPSAQSVHGHASGTQSQRRAFSTSARAATAAPQPDAEESAGGHVDMAGRHLALEHGKVDEIVHVLRDYVDVNTQGQITRLPEHVLEEIAAGTYMQPALDHDLDHAPVRQHDLSAEEREVAIANALKYFDAALHETMRPVCESELDAYGHIYLYPVMPRVALWAIPFDAIPAAGTDAKAMIHMILNNLDTRVAQFPQELITYGGNGAIFSNWAQFHITVQLLQRMLPDQCLNMVSGHPQGLFPKLGGKDALTPAAVITNGMMVSNYSTKEHLDRLYAMGVTMYGQMTAGSWMYIGPQGIVHGTTLTLAQAVKLQAQQQGQAGAGAATDGERSCAGKVFVTSGLGGMSGAQPKAGTINGAVCIVAEVNEKALRKRHEQGWLDETFESIPALMARAKEAQDRREGVSLGYLGNVVDLWEYLADSANAGDERPRIAVGSDQTSLHNPYNGGYYPVSLSFEESQELMTKDPATFKDHVQESLRRHIAAVERVRQQDGMFFFDYGNAFLLECHRAGAPVPEDIQSYVECIMGPEYFDFGFGPYRWVCTSASAEDLRTTDQIAEQVLREQLDENVDAIRMQLRANHEWIQASEEHNLVVGSQARILYSDTQGRINCAVRMNEAVADGRLSAPVVIGRDHHDVSGTDSPWRETANIRDGSNLTADMAVQNVIGDAMRGATWVSLHNGGGTGWGEACNGGFGLVLDGSAQAEERARTMIFFDVANGLTRRARAGNPHAIDTIRRLADEYPKFQPFFPSLSV